MKTRTRQKKRNATRQGNGITIRMPDALDLRVRDLAHRHGLKMADVVRNALWMQVPLWERDGVKVAAVAA